MLILGNGIVITLNKDSEIISKGGVVIEGGRILDLGDTSILQKKYPHAIFKNVQGKIIMPGMINTHTHLYSTFARGMDLKTAQLPTKFGEILEKLWWRLDKALGEKDIYYSALYALLDCIKKGTTTIFDHHASSNLIEGSLDILEEAVQQSGIRASLAYEVSDRDGHQKALAGIRENERFIKKIKRNNSGYLNGMIGLHAAFTLQNSTLEKAADLADELETPFHLHIAEGKEDYYDSKTRGYKGVAYRLNQHRILRPGTLAIHGVNLSEEEWEILRDSGSYLIHNPESNMNNAVGALPIQAVLNKGVQVGLGTDGYTADMFESIKVANLLQKHEMKDPQAGGQEIFDLVFHTNREIANKFFDKKLGTLQIGAPADLIVIDYYSPTPINRNNFYFHLLFGITGDRVDTTIVGGKILMEGKEIINLDYKILTQKVQEQAFNFWERF